MLEVCIIKLQNYYYSCVYKVVFVIDIKKLILQTRYFSKKKINQLMRKMLDNTGNHEEVNRLSKLIAKETLPSCACDCYR